MTDEEHEDSLFFGGDIVAFVQCLLGDTEGASEETGQETKARLLQTACQAAPKGIQKRKRLKATQAWHEVGKCACCE